MVQALPKLVTFADFISWLPKDGCYELISTDRPTRSDLGFDTVPYNVGIEPLDNKL